MKTWKVWFYSRTSTTVQFAIEFRGDFDFVTKAAEAFGKSVDSMMTWEIEELK